MPINQDRPARLRPFFPLLISFAAALQASTANAQIQIPNGKSDFRFVDRKGDPSKVIPVFTYLPENLKASEARIIFVMHGHHRSAEGYRNDWAKHANHFGFMVLAPLFDEQQWGNGQYTYASVLTKSGKIRDSAKWSFSVIEHLFDAVKQATGNRTTRYYLFGFSEGASSCTASC